MVMAIVFEPATTTLWAIGVAIAIAFDQLWPGRLGILAGYRTVTVGATQETSPMSSEPPLTGCGGGAWSGWSVVLRPLSRPSTRLCPAFARVCPSPVHGGSPPRAILACTASAIGLLKWRGAAT